MVWIVKLVSIGAEGEQHSTEVLRIAKPDDLTDLAALALTLAEGKRLLASGRRSSPRRPGSRPTTASTGTRVRRQWMVERLAIMIVEADSRDRSDASGAVTQAGRASDY